MDASPPPPWVHHLQAIMDEREKMYGQRFAAQEEAVRGAKADLQARLDLLNELRVGVATKAEMDALEKMVLGVNSRLDHIEGRSTGMSMSWAVLLGAITVAVGIYVALS